MDFWKRNLMNLLNEIPKKKLFGLFKVEKSSLQNDSLIEALINFRNHLDKTNAMSRLFIVSSKNPVLQFPCSRVNQHK